MPCVGSSVRRRLRTPDVMFEVWSSSKFLREVGKYWGIAESRSQCRWNMGNLVDPDGREPFPRGKKAGRVKSFLFSSRMNLSDQV